MDARAPLAGELLTLAERLARALGERESGARAVEMVVERAPDERLALAFLLSLAELSPASLRAALGERALAGELVFCLGSSELVASGLAAMGPQWFGFFRQARAGGAGALRGAMSFRPPEPGAAPGSALAEFKRRAFLNVAIADLLDRLTVGETMSLMSLLAEQCVRAALALAATLLGPEARAAGEFCVLALGKLGAYELNLSSDLDLFYLCEPGGTPRARESAARLGATLTDLLSANCFRIDLRLRPGGQSSPLVASLEGALSFYQSFGQTWERAALLRARPLAGSLELGRRLLAELGPFIYRRYLDFDTLSQLRTMKHRIETELRSPEMVERNIKLGRGGIRELEFIVQALTLVYGGRDPRLRRLQTLDALARLESLGYLAASRARELAAAYLFLRDVEHKLQVVAGLQTHTLPAGAQGMGALAARMGFGKEASAAERFRSTLERHRELVAAIFREMLAGEEQRLSAPASAAARDAWQAAAEPKAAAPRLASMGFARAAESAAHLLALARGSQHAPSSARRDELIESLGPRLLDEICALPDPDLALMNLAAFISAVGARTSFLALLESHPATRAVLLRLFASSSYLSTLFIRHPDMLDILVRSDLARLRASQVELERELAGMIAAVEDFEARLDALRVLRHQEFLRIAIADLAGRLTLEEVQAELTLLASTVLRQALAMARDAVAARRPGPDSLALSVVAMGRLGAGEMSYNSDLDLIFVYHDGAQASDREAASKTFQKLISILQARTREGYAYKIDLRLRPSGNAGPLVTSLQGFIDYHRQSSAVWERQALVRARVLAGDAALGEQVEAARQEFVFGRPIGRAELDEIAAMRARMEREIGAENGRRLNLKQGPGGLVDVEFLAQMMALRYGGRHRALRQRDTTRLLGALVACKLITAQDGGRLKDHYRFLLQLENRLRIEGDQPAWALSTRPADLTALARRMGYGGEPGARRLLDELHRRRSEVREIFVRCFEAERARAA